MPRPIKGSSPPTNSEDDDISAAVLASPPLPAFPRWMVEGLILGLLKKTRKQQGNEALRKKTARRVMFFLDTCARRSSAQNNPEHLASEIERLLTKRYPAPDHPAYAVEHHGRFVAPLVKTFPFSSALRFRYQWLKKHLAKILAQLKETSRCNNCSKRVSRPSVDKLLNMAACEYPGQLRNEILAYHHRLSTSTVQRMVASGS